MNSKDDQEKSIFKKEIEDNAFTKAAEIITQANAAEQAIKEKFEGLKNDLDDRLSHAENHASIIRLNSDMEFELQAVKNGLTADLHSVFIKRCDALIGKNIPDELQKDGPSFEKFIKNVESKLASLRENKETDIFIEPKIENNTGFEERNPDLVNLYNKKFAEWKNK